MTKTDTRHVPVSSYPRNAGAYVQEGNAGRAGLFVRLFGAIAKILFLLVFRVRVYSLQNVPSTPAIVCVNHLGWADTFLVLLFLPAEPRIYVLGERQVTRISAFRAMIITRLKVMVPLDRGKPREALDLMADILQRGGSLLIFPEGQLGYEEGTIGELQHGAAHISQITGAPLLPVGLTGSSELWVGRRLEVRIGAPINPGDFEGDQRDRIRAMTALLGSEMRSLLPGDPQRPKIKPLRRWLTNLL